MLPLRVDLGLAALCLLTLPLTACGEESGSGDSGGADSGILPSGSTSADDSMDSTSDDDSSGSSTGEKLDVAASSTGDDEPCAESGDCDECEAPEHVACDGDASNIITAMGLNCPGEPIVLATVGGAPTASGTMASFGPTNAFAPTEGQRYAVIGSGFVSGLPTTTGCSDDVGAFDPLTNLAAPIVPVDVGGGGCAADPGLIGTGDCSNTIETQFTQAAQGAYDYTEVRFTATVPQGVTSFSYDFAFFSYEYPVFYDSQYNDIYIGWLESEEWTGNISFDDQGNPISLNAGFMDFLDADATGHPDCPTGTGCTAPELAGTCMQGHGGSRWLTTEASVIPGEEITVVFAIMDLGDSILDSYVFLDNFQWGCEGGSPPSTVPID